MTIYPQTSRRTLKIASLLAVGGLVTTVTGATVRAEPPPAAMVPPPPPGVKLAFATKGEAHAKPTKLTIEFIAQKDSASPTDAQMKLNQLVDNAMKTTSDQTDIKTSAGNYSISQEYSQKGPTHWSARQTIKISGTDSQKLLSYTEKLQKLGLNVDNFIWSLDPQTHQKLEQEARSDALKKVRAQAESDAHDLGLKFIRLEGVIVHTGGMPDHPGPHPMMLMARASDAAGPQPQTTPEDQSVTVTVMAKAQLGNP
ncbi:SIMPL domain-containing protein [Acetobacteraceae bacterium ESL0709]|nr:SIMPL domain-containing protein [Acetobacteraceae bacterium ESL0697]MDF7678804.1 SIMPL domain-containing protein [Acetobacteraceae bacterium ESL0709]